MKLCAITVIVEDVDSPTFIGLRQRDFDMVLETEVSINQGKAGVTVYLNAVRLSGNKAKLIIRGESCRYSFFVAEGEKETMLGAALR